MEIKLDTWLGVLIVLLQVLCGVEATPCSPGFTSDVFVLTVHRSHLQRGTRIGAVVFNDCSGRTQSIFDTADKRFHVDSDGTVKLKRQVTLHNGHKGFSVHAWDSKGQKHTALVRVEYEDSANRHKEQQEDVEASELEQLQSPSIPILEFPKSNGLRRRKREWVIPPIRILENDRGPFPSKLVRIKSSHEKENKMVYRITGVGANLPPVGLFTIDKNNGQMFVGRPLDREEQDKYVLQAHAESLTDAVVEPEMKVIVEVLDANDNLPIFTQDPFIGSVPEASKPGFEFMTVSATDADDPNTDNAVIRYSIVEQIPPEPHPNMFAINPVSGAIRVNIDGLDREKYREYTLKIDTADMVGEGRAVPGTAIITVTDSNDNAPKFVKNLFNVTVPEDKVGVTVVKLPVIDEDEPQSSAWAAKFRIVGGNPNGFFSISTGPSKQKGIITTIKGLDYENNNKFTLLVVVENEVPFAKALPTSTATVIVNVLDVNEAPVFDPKEMIVSKPEDLAINSELTVYTATDPDTYRNQKLTYRLGNDPAGWLTIIPDTGLIKVRSPMDRESNFVKDGKYRALILAIDDDALPATGTGTLIIELEDVNDNAPTIDMRLIPPIRVSENEGGFKEHFPKEIAEFKSSHAKTSRVKYVISGGGANLPPVGLFVMDKNTGKLYVLRSLDRETKDEYVLQAHLMGDNIHDEIVEFTIQVVDQNDNKPVFTQDPFIGSVSDASKIGFQFMTISATDADDPNTENSDIRYSIISQDPPEPKPNMFAINPITGVIRVNAEGLDFSKHSKYVLKIQAADMQGNGLTSTGDAVIFVINSKDVTKPSSPGTWEISPICFPENDRGPFPKQLAKIKSNHDKQSKVVYSITGKGADQPPVGLFTVDKDSGLLSVTRTLDRETNHEYVLQVHRGGINEQPTQITISVIDQNDNKPVFTQDPFRGSVPKASKPGFEFMTISATDADDPKTENANIRYSIISQDPALPQLDMFEINPISGVIQVKTDGLDREKYPEYTLEIQAADMQGNGLQSRGKAVITVTV